MKYWLTMLCVLIPTMAFAVSPIHSDPRTLQAATTSLVVEMSSGNMTIVSYSSSPHFLCGQSGSPNQYIVFRQGSLPGQTFNGTSAVSTIAAAYAEGKSFVIGVNPNAGNRCYGGKIVVWTVEAIP